MKGVLAILQNIQRKSDFDVFTISRYRFDDTKLINVYVSKGDDDSQSFNFYSYQDDYAREAEYKRLNDYINESNSKA